MTHKQTLQEVKQKVIEAVPEIMDLKFGCRVIVDWFDGEIPDEKNSQEVICYHVRENGKGRVFDPTLNLAGVVTKILGRTITLADVLLAMGKVGSKSRAYNEKEWKLAHFMAHNVLKIVGDWHCSDNNLDNQSPETIQFLHDVL